MDAGPKTLMDAVKYFKWPDGRICCPKCDSDKVGVIRSRSMLQCKAKECRKQFSVKVGTIFEDIE